MAEHSKAQANKIIRWIGSDQERFDELFRIFLNDEYRVVQRAAWPLSYCVINHPVLIRKHFAKMIANLEKPGVGDAVKRNTLRLLQHIDLPEKYQGPILNLCLDYINDPREKIAVKAFALAILGRLYEYYPEIGPELKTIIESRWDYETPAFHSRARKILKQINRTPQA